MGKRVGIEATPVEGFAAPAAAMDGPGTPAQERAASFIQAVWRGKKARKHTRRARGKPTPPQPRLRRAPSTLTGITRDMNMHRVDMTRARMTGKSYYESVHAFSSLMLRLPLWETILIGLALSFLTCVIFAGLFALEGEECFSGTFDKGTFLEEMLWLSVHTWSTVGYGSEYPTCAGGQILVFLQSYLVIMLNTVLMGVVLYQFLVARPRVRFSKDILRCTASDGCPMLVFRMCRLSHDLRDLTCSVQAPFSLIKDGKVVGVIYKNLEFVGKDVPRAGHDDEVNNRLAALDQWTLYHRIDENSPLRDDPMLASPSLRGFSVSIVAFETSYCIEARIYKTYSYKDVVHGKEFVSMTEYAPTKSAPNLLRPIYYTNKIDLISGVVGTGDKKLSPRPTPAASSSTSATKGRSSTEPGDEDAVAVTKLRASPC